MKCESDFKTIFKKSARKIGGYCESIAAPVLPGIPDLYCAIPGFMPVLLEAKFYKELPEKFNRKIPYSAMQQRWLRECNRVHPASAFGLIGLVYKNQHYCMLVDDKITHVSNELLVSRGHIIQHKFIDVSILFTFHVPKAYMQPLDVLTEQANHVNVGVGS